MVQGRYILTSSDTIRAFKENKKKFKPYCERKSCDVSTTFGCQKTLRLIKSYLEKLYIRIEDHFPSLSTHVFDRVQSS